MDSLSTKILLYSQKQFHKSLKKNISINAAREIPFELLCKKYKKRTPSEIHFSLQVLMDEGYIMYVPEPEHPSSILLTTSGVTYRLSRFDKHVSLTLELLQIISYIYTLGSLAYKLIPVIIELISPAPHS